MMKMPARPTCLLGLPLRTARPVPAFVPLDPIQRLVIVVQADQNGIAISNR